MTPEELEALILLLAPEFANDPRFPSMVELVAGEVSLTHCFRNRVLVLLAAHALTVAGSGGVVGQVAAEKEGDLSREYFSLGIEEAGLTSYGVEVKRLNRLCYGMTARTGWITRG